MGLGHASRGSGEQRQVHVFKTLANASPPLSAMPTTADGSRRAPNRAATIDFSDAARGNEGGGVGGGGGGYATLRNQKSGYLGVVEGNGFNPAGNGGSGGGSNNLRTAKSFADLRSYTPSPVPSSASFPAALQSNGARLQHQQQQQQQQYEGGSTASNTPTLMSKPTTANDNTLLVNSLGGLSLGTGIGGGPGSSPRRLRGMFSWEQDQPSPSSAGPIGSNRSAVGLGVYDSPSQQERIPIRQPRGPTTSEKGPGFRRQNGHQSNGSDELRANSGVEIIVE